MKNVCGRCYSPVFVLLFIHCSRSYPSFTKLRNKQWNAVLLIAEEETNFPIFDFLNCLSLIRNSKFQGFGGEGESNEDNFWKRPLLQISNCTKFRLHT